MASLDSNAAWSFYSSQSGLTPPQNYSLSDHQFAFWAAALGGTGKTLADLELAYCRANTTLQYANLDDAQLAYFYQQLSVATGAIDDVSSAFFSGAGAATLGFGLDPFGTTGFGV